MLFSACFISALFLVPVFNQMTNLSVTVYSAGAHLQRTGETICAFWPSTVSLLRLLPCGQGRSILQSYPAFRGCPASFMVANTFSFVSIMI